MRPEGNLQVFDVLKKLFDISLQDRFAKHYCRGGQVCCRTADEGPVVLEGEVHCVG